MSKTISFSIEDKQAKELLIFCAETNRKPGAGTYRELLAAGVVHLGKTEQQPKRGKK